MTAQEIVSHALQAGLVLTEGGDISFIVTTDNVQVAKEVCGTAVDVTKELCGTAVELTKVICCTTIKIGAIYAGYRLSKPLIDAAVAKVLGGGEKDR